MVDGLLAVGPEGAPNCNVAGPRLGKFIRPSFVERPFAPSITFVSTAPCEELTRLTLFSDDAFLCVLVALLLFDKSSALVLASVFIMLFLEMGDSTTVDLVAWVVLPLRELGSSVLWGGSDSKLGTVVDTAACGPGTVEPFTPLLNKVPVFDFVESKFLDGVAAFPFAPCLRMGSILR